jgi:serine phosphatase RsbU (regulator of sigma subunit)
MSVDNLKNQIIENQKMIDDLNRKTREVKIIQEISSEINSILDLSSILTSILQSLERVFEFRHSMILLFDEESESLSVKASHGYADKGIGAIVKSGEGIIGVVAKRKKIMRMGNIATQIAYTATVRSQFEQAGQQDKLTEKIKLPGLANVQSQVAIPLLVKEKLIGVLAVESEKSNVFDERDEMIITIISNQAASAIENARLYEAEKLRIEELNNANEQLLKLNESLEEKVRERTSEVMMQKDLVEEKNREVRASIEYALRIQKTILPSENYMNEHLGDYFIYYKPKDIVSGDFYWVNQKEDITFFAAIDCTGHGVPGALMSIVAHGNLQRAIHIFKLRQPNEILDLINADITEGFRKSGNDIRDGMDISLCAINRKTMKLEFSGANSSLYIINASRTSWPEGSLNLGENLPGVEIRGDKQPVGHFENSKKFTPREIDLQKGDILYVFSDGYADQFGGSRGKKFMKARFKELLVSIHQQPPEKQKKLLEQSLYHWKGNMEQVDDMLVIGVKV